MREEINFTKHQISVCCCFLEIGFLGIGYFLTLQGEKEFYSTHFTCVSIVYYFITNHPKSSWLMTVSSLLLLMILWVCWTVLVASPGLHHVCAPRQRFSWGRTIQDGLIDRSGSSGWRFAEPPGPLFGFSSSSRRD